MPAPTHYSPTALAYAQALLELAEERKQPLDALRQELTDLLAIIEADNAVRLYLADPSISAEQRERTIERVFSGKVSPLLYNFLRLLNQKNRLNLFPELAGGFGELVDEKLGKVEVDLTVAHKLTPDQLKEATEKISAALKREAVVHVYVDESIIGGTVVRVGDKLLDASVKSQLAAMREKLLTSRQK